MKILSNDTPIEFLKSEILSLEDSERDEFGDYGGGIFINGWQGSSAEIFKVADKYHVYGTPVYGGESCFYNSFDLDELDRMLKDIFEQVC